MTKDGYKSIAYLGSEGSYSFLAAKRYFLKGTIMLGKKGFIDIFDSVSENSVETGVIPLENSLTGSIYESYDLLLSRNLQIVGEVILHINHLLLTREDNKVIKKDILSKATVCFAHPEAFRQCRKFFLQQSQIDQVFVEDTAKAISQLLKSNEVNAFAIGNEYQSQKYSLRILEKEFTDSKENFTRFVMVSKRKNRTGTKASLIFSVAHKPGSLIRALTPYAAHGLNLTKIESRPVLGKPWEYIFLIDLNLGDNPDRLTKVLEAMKVHVNYVKVLGVYEKGNVYDA